MTDQLTALRRKYGYFIPYEQFTHMVLPKSKFKITTKDKDTLIKYALIVDITYHTHTNSPLKYIFLGRNKKKLRNIFKKRKLSATTLNKITKYNEQTKLTTKTKISTITNVINRVKADWEHIRS